MLDVVLQQLRFVGSDLPSLAGVDLRSMPWRERREPQALVARAVEGPVHRAPPVEPCEAIAREKVDGSIVGIVRKDRESRYKDGSRAGWWKIEDRGWNERGAWRFDRR